MAGLFEQIYGGGIQPQKAPQSTPAAPRFDFESLYGGFEQPKAAAPAPESKSWVGSLVDTVRGKQDPQFKDLPVYSGHDVAQTGAGVGMLASGGTDDDFADMIAKQLGDRHVRTFKDANGYPIVEYKTPDGGTKQEYVNKPGLDTADVYRGVASAVPYVATGGLAGGALKGAGYLANVVGQGLAAGVTNAGAQVGRQAAGGEQSIDPVEVGVTAAGGAVAQAAAPAIGAAWRKFITEPSLFDSASGKLTEKGIAAARAAGMNPDEITPDIAKTFATQYAKSGNASAAAVDSTLGYNDIPASRGQITKDPQQLLTEKGMRYGMYGDDAKTVMQQFDKAQAQAVQDAALGGSKVAKHGGVAGAIAPDVVPATAPGATVYPRDLGANVKTGLDAAQTGAKAAENAAWGKVTALEPTQDAFKLLPDAINKRVADVAIDSQVTPAAAKMAQELDAFMAGKAPEQVAKVLQNNPVKTVDQMRRRLLSYMGGASSGEDKRAAGRLYEGFNDWIDVAAAQNLLNGDAAAAAELRIARGLTREVKDLFSPQGPAGRLSAGGQRLKAAMEKADSPEGIVDALLGSAGSRTVTTGTTDALKNLKAMMTRFAPQQAEETWQSVKLAYWTRLVQNKTGEMLGPQAISSNIKRALTDQRSVFETLYTPMERQRIGIFLRGMENIAYKDPNPSGSGTAIGVYAKELFKTMWDALGLNSKWAQVAIERSGLVGSYGAAVAKSAVSGAVPKVTPNLGPAGAVLGNRLETPDQ